MDTAAQISELKREVSALKAAQAQAGNVAPYFGLSGTLSGPLWAATEYYFKPINEQSNPPYLIFNFSAYSYTGAFVNNVWISGDEVHFVISVEAQNPNYVIFSDTVGRLLRA